MMTIITIIIITVITVITIMVTTIIICSAPMEDKCVVLSHKASPSLSSRCYVMVWYTNSDGIAMLRE